MPKLSWSDTSMAWLSQLCECAPEAWDRYMKRRRPGIIAIALSEGVSPTDVEDVASDVALSLFELMKDGRYTYKEGKTFNGYLYTMARNKARDFQRRRGAQPKQLQDHYDVEDPVRREWDTEDEECRRALEKWIRQLEADGGGRDLEIWRATALEGKPPADVASEHGIKIAEVYRAKSRMNKLYRAWADRFLASDKAPSW